VRSGVMEASDTSYIEDRGSTFIYNHARHMAVFKITSDSYLNFSNSFFYKNHAEEVNSIG
jgi:hypothetical protein